mmetsp:Transcript_2027/g.3154  ORF Transcript_2027/g.3154 Transcript_2027/m.3154 type:complete len:182 (+) Transcript_2027:61-606(+)
MAQELRRSAFGALAFEMKFWARYLLPTRYLAVYYCTPDHVVQRMLKLADVGPQDRVYDLGCGDGRVLLAAAKLGASAVGYELDLELAAAAEAAIKRDNLEHCCTVHAKDARKADVSTATVLTLYLSDRGNRELMTLLSPSLKPGTRIVSNAFSIHGWEEYLVKTIQDPAAGPMHLYQFKLK